MDLDGEKIVTIELGDADRTTYTVMASQKQVMKFSAATASAGTAAGDVHAASPPTDDVEPPMELVGTDTIDGKPAQKNAVRMGNGTSFVWLDASTELLVRMEADGLRMEMKNYDFSPPPPELFALPKGYEVVDLNQMMKSVRSGGPSAPWWTVSSVSASAPRARTSRRDASRVAEVGHVWTRAELSTDGRQSC